MSEHPRLENDDWEVVFEPYERHASEALGLARLFSLLKSYLESTPPNTPEALAAIEQAVGTLYPHTDFHRGAYDLYRTFLEGRATRAHEVLMESLGIRF